MDVEFLQGFENLVAVNAKLRLRLRMAFLHMMFHFCQGDAGEITLIAFLFFSFHSMNLVNIAKVAVQVLLISKRFTTNIAGCHLGIT